MKNEIQSAIAPANPGSWIRFVCLCLLCLVFPCSLPAATPDSPAPGGATAATNLPTLTASQAMAHATAAPPAPRTNRPTTTSNSANASRDSTFSTTTVILFGAAGLCFIFMAFSLSTGDGARIETHWGGLGGGVSGVRLSPALIYFLLTLFFSILGLVVPSLVSRAVAGGEEAGASVSAVATVESPGKPSAEK